VKILDAVILICVTVIALSSVALAFRPSDELQALQIAKVQLEIKLLERDLKAYADMDKELQSE